MCEVSMHVPHRRATAKERLVVTKLPPYPSMRGLYPAKGTDQHLLVCTRGHTKALIKRVHFEEGMSRAFAEYEGKRNVAVVLFRRNHQDYVRFPSGIECIVTNLQVGTRIDIGIPVKKRAKPVPAGMKVVNAAIKEVLSTDPKPPGQGEQPAEQPTPNKEPGEQKPVEPGQEGPQQPQPEPAKARRRRTVKA